MITVHVCGPAAKIARGISQATQGQAVDAITLGEYVLVFEPVPEGDDYVRLMRHEAVHVKQQASMAPRWARWLPKRVRVWLGAPQFFDAYWREWQRGGYAGNKFEIEARAAE